MNYYMDTKYCRITEEYEPEHRYIVTGPCIRTGKTVRVSIPAPELFTARNNGFGPKTAPSLSADEREFLMNGLSAEGWDLMFPLEEEE